MYSFLKKNDTAPEFTASTYDQENVDLKQLLGKGPVLLSFLRGFS